ncbi:MAG: YbaK/EbsC family protein [Coriobacteriia bacterium]|nr:YbaK/EbsC family protein [Coriobacteriia bacterium]
MERVRAVLREHGLEEGLVTFPTSTATAALAAEAVGCELGQIVKSLVFEVDGRPVLALVAGDRRGDAEAIARESGGSGATMADAGMVREATGYAIGGVSPFGLPAGLPVLVDASLLRFEVVYPAAGTPSSAARVPLPKLLALVGGRLAPISSSPV